MSAQAHQEILPTPEGSSTKPSPPPRPSLRRYNERLGLPYPIRQAVTSFGGGFVGLAMGLSLGAKTSALRFRAENAHRLPTSHKGWYLYHKSKNYQAMWGGLKEGGRMGAKIGFWSGLFVAVEEIVDRRRHGTKDALSTVIAGLACSCAFSAWNRFPLVTAAKTARLSLVASLAFGLGQDFLGVLRGREVSYLSFYKRKISGWGSGTAV